MSFHSKAFLADRERLLEPEPVHGTRSTKWHQDQHEVHTIQHLPPPDLRTERELEEMENAYLRYKGVI